MRYNFRIIRTQTLEHSIRARDEDSALQQVREELTKPYGFIGRWEDAALDVELVGTDDDNIVTNAQGLATGEPLLLSVVGAAEHLGISRSLMYELLNRGDIDSVRLGRRRLVSRDAINRFIAQSDSHSH
jgi:excisionase family DNA binding protein